MVALLHIVSHEKKCDWGFKVTEIVSGGCPSGADAAGERWASENDVGVLRFKAEWEKYGKAAGPIRNKKMAEYADALLLIWDGKSPGSRNMREEMKKLGKKIYEVKVK